MDSSLNSELNQYLRIIQTVTLKQFFCFWYLSPCLCFYVCVTGGSDFVIWVLAINVIPVVLALFPSVMSIMVLTWNWILLVFVVIGVVIFFQFLELGWLFVFQKFSLYFWLGSISCSVPRFYIIFCIIWWFFVNYIFAIVIVEVFESYQRFEILTKDFPFHITDWDLLLSSLTNLRSASIRKCCSATFSCFFSPIKAHHFPSNLFVEK